MKTPVFTGACTALVTPFDQGKVNLSMLERLIARQIESGINAIVLCGTTGEAPTLSDQEKLTIFTHARRFAPECTLIAGTGSNDTRHAVFLSHAAEDVGMDALLVVTPYYNKATPEGMIAHYKAVAASVHIPVIAYNVPGRTGLDLPVSVCREISAIPNITGIKEASSAIAKASAIRAACPSSFALWSGNDDMTVPMMSIGALGVISVTSNVAPMIVQAMTKAALAGDFDTASALQLELSALNDALFREVNPIPVKTAMQILGYDCGSCRLPLTPASSQTRQTLAKILCKHTEYIT